MNRVTLQVPIDRSLKLSAEKVASEYGFSSLQEVIRVFMAQFANKKLMVGFSQVTADETLTEEQEAFLTKKYEKAKVEIKSGKGYVAKTAREMLAQLRS